MFVLSSSSMVKMGYFVYPGVTKIQSELQPVVVMDFGMWSFYFQIII